MAALPVRLLGRLPPARLSAVFRCSSSSVGGLWTHALPARGVLRVRGAESADFLQGLVTNDMHHFDDGARCIYAMMLNTKGRVLFDLMIYRKELHDGCASFLVEADSSLLGKLQSLLKIYRVRRKIDIEDISDSCSVVLVRELPSVGDPITPCSTAADCTEHGRPAHVTAPLELPLAPEPAAAAAVVAASRDPRLPALGWRLLLDSSTSPSVVLPDCDSYSEDPALLRYTLGVPEGAAEIPHANCTPLEFNCDYLHGVSFHKGCYIGQELTARTHHTGVVRKRIMPLQFSIPPPAGAADGASVIDVATGKAVGKVRAASGTRGLGLMRIQESLAASSLQLEGTDCRVRSQRPAWWPEMMAKERQG